MEAEFPQIMLVDDENPTLMRRPKTAEEFGLSALGRAAPVDGDLPAVLMRFGHSSFVALDAVLARHQLSMLEWQALTAIFLLEQATAAQVARRVYRSAAQSTVLLARLGNRGWASETEGIRPARYMLTEKALAVMPYPELLNTALDTRINAALSKHEQTVLAQLLWRVLSA
jgi:predicted transcriptional regulator